MGIKPTPQLYRVSRKKQPVAPVPQVNVEAPVEEWRLILAAEDTAERAKRARLREARLMERQRKKDFARDLRRSEIAR